MVRRWISENPGKALVVVIAIALLLGGWGFVMTGLRFNPVPGTIPDEGHRVFSVKDKHAHDTVLKVLGEVGGMGVKRQFHVCGTHQTLLSDKRTVIMYLDEDTDRGDAISRAVPNPREAADTAKAIFEADGYAAEIEEITCDDLPPGNLFVVHSNVFNNASLALRKSIIDGMPRPLEGIE